MDYIERNIIKTTFTIASICVFIELLNDEINLC